MEAALPRSTRRYNTHWLAMMCAADATNVSGAAATAVDAHDRATTSRTRERQLPCTATNINKNYELGGGGEGEFLLFIETWV